MSEEKSELSPEMERYRLAFEAIGRFGTELAERWRRHMAEFARRWPPERVVASAIEEYNRRMAEINRR